MHPTIDGPGEQVVTVHWHNWTWLLCGGLLLAVVIGGGIELLGWSAAALLANPLLLLVVPGLFVVPGLALLRLLWPADQPLEVAERVALAIGLSVALAPLLFLWCTLIGLPLGPPAAWGYLLLSLLVTCAPPRPWRTRALRLALPRLHREELLLLAITLIALGARVYVARDLPVGMWGDSYHHTMITQLLVDNAGLFTSWQPYAQLTTMSYHPGFHSNAALFHMLSGVSVPRAVVVVGQMLNAAALPLAYLLTLRLGFGRQAALWAALLTGFVSPMPAYYVNWGRYTQLAGHLVLAVVLVCWIALLDRNRRSWRLAALLGLTGAAMVLTHYRVVFFACAMALAYLLYSLFVARAWRRPFPWIGGGAVAALVAAALAAPWLPRLFTSVSAQHARSVAQRNIRFDEMNALPDITQLLTFYTRPVLLGLTLVGVVWLLVQRRWQPLSLVLAAVLVWLVANPFLLGLPGAGVITNFAVVIAAYLVLAPLAGYAVQQLVGMVARQSVVGRGLATALVVTVVGWGLYDQRDLISADSQLFTPADAAAMAWIAQQTPGDALFLVNSFFAYGGGVAVGSDGGWWIPLLAGRASTLPPVTYGTERGPIPDYRVQTNQVIKDVQAAGTLTAAGVEQMRRHGIDYVYSGAHIGQPDRFDPELLGRTPGLDVVYNQNGVVIARVVY